MVEFGVIGLSLALPSKICALCYIRRCHPFFTIGSIKFSMATLSRCLCSPHSLAAQSRPPSAICGLPNSCHPSRNYRNHVPTTAPTAALAPLFAPNALLPIRRVATLPARYMLSLTTRTSTPSRTPMIPGTPSSTPYRTTATPGNLAIANSVRSLRIVRIDVSS